VTPRPGLLPPSGRVLAPLLLALAACGAQARSADPVVRDQEIKRDIRWKYHSDARLIDVTVDCSEGAVVLKGRVVTPEAKADAERIALDVRSVRSVKNSIDVKPK